MNISAPEEGILLNHHTILSRSSLAWASKG
jgi:hypothetical protein